MNKSFKLLCLLACVSGAVAAVENTVCTGTDRVTCQGKNNKIYVCHVPPGNEDNPNTLCIAESAIDTHIDQHANDYCGACDTLPPTATPEVSTPPPTVDDCIKDYDSCDEEDKFAVCTGVSTLCISLAEYDEFSLESDEFDCGACDTLPPTATPEVSTPPPTVETPPPTVETPPPTVETPPPTVETPPPTVETPPPTVETPPPTVGSTPERAPAAGPGPGKPPGTPGKPSPSGSNGDPHFKTWRNEHFEYHGQCDLVLAKDPDFADGLGIDVQIRTKLVRFWSYIHRAAIRIGNDILEIQGTGELDGLSTAHYWVNFEYQGELSTIGGFPVTLRLHEINDKKRFFEIDLSSKYPGVKIAITSFREFIRVEFDGHTTEAFGNVEGMLGNYKSGKTLGRDGETEIHDFTKLGNEWQVLPVENMLFHDISEPQFPKKCIEPEDPQGERRRRLAEATVSEEQAEAACASIQDPLDKKDCIYDVLATQDLDMVGAF